MGGLDLLVTIIVPVVIAGLTEVIKNLVGKRVVESEISQALVTDEQVKEVAQRAGIKVSPGDIAKLTNQINKNLKDYLTERATSNTSTVDEQSKES